LSILSKLANYLHYNQDLNMKHLLILFIFFSITLLFSCDGSDPEPIDPTLAQLEVYVFGTLSNEPRDGIRVSLHATEDDAKDGDDELYGRQFTDSEGFADFINVQPGKIYWVRAKPLITRNVKATQFLVAGRNSFEIGVP
jgi:hypothetical protein